MVFLTLEHTETFTPASAFLTSTQTVVVKGRRSYPLALTECM